MNSTFTYSTNALENEYNCLHENMIYLIFQVYENCFKCFTHLQSGCCL